MKATELIKKQHRLVEDLFEKFDKAKGHADKKKAFEKIAANLVSHDAIERELLYPACERQLGQDDDILEESLVEHGVVEFCLFRADQHERSEELEAYVKVLKEVVEHHVEEEEKELIPKIERAFAKEKLEELGTKMEARFAQAMKGDFRAPLRDALEQVLQGKTRTVKRPKAAAARAARVGRTAAKKRARVTRGGASTRRGGRASSGSGARAASR